MICFDFGVSIDWTAVSAIATLLMTIATFVTIIYNRKQIKEIQRQWNEEHKARLLFSIVVNNGLFLLKIENAGKRSAYNIHIEINDSFLDKMLIKSSRDRMINMLSKNLYMQPGRIIYCSISPTYGTGSLQTNVGLSYSGEQINKNLDILKKEPIVLRGSYNNQEIINEEFTMDDFIGSIVVQDPISESIDECNKTLKNINKEISTIVKN